MEPLQKWFPNHGPEQTQPTLLKAVEGLKQQGISKFGATGYCFGSVSLSRLAPNVCLSFATAASMSSSWLKRGFWMSVSSTTLRCSSCRKTSRRSRAKTSP